MDERSPGIDALRQPAQRHQALRALKLLQCFAGAFASFHALKDINLKVLKGERIVICRPSGCGKSTMIRGINRLEQHEKGRARRDGRSRGRRDDHAGRDPRDGLRASRRRSVIFMDAGRIVEENELQAFFDNPRHQRTKALLDRILH
jgi:ABC-type polar amino acid transport system ATPase subunit